MLHAALLRMSQKARAGRLQQIDLLFTRAKEEGFDTLVVVDPSAYDNARLLEPPYGYFERNLVGAQLQHCIYSLFTVDVFDVNAKKRIAWEWGFDPTWEGICQEKNTSVEWKENFDQYTENEKDQMKHLVLKEIREGLQHAVPELNLLQ